MKFLKVSYPLRKTWTPAPLPSVPNSFFLQKTCLKLVLFSGTVRNTLQHKALMRFSHHYQSSGRIWIFISEQQEKEINSTKNVMASQNGDRTADGNAELGLVYTASSCDNNADGDIGILQNLKLTSKEIVANQVIIILHLHILCRLFLTNVC